MESQAPRWEGAGGEARVSTPAYTTGTGGHKLEMILPAVYGPGEPKEVVMEQFNSILMSYLRVTQHMSQQFRTHFGRLNLTFPQALVLTVLGEEGPVPISTLAERTGSANSTVSGIVDRLEKLGLARRERSATDRRVIYVVATEKYRQLRLEAETDVSGYFTTLLQTMPEEDRQLVATALHKLDEALTLQQKEQEQEGNGSVTP